jgi:hypothetical protein
VDTRVGVTGLDYLYLTVPDFDTTMRSTSDTDCHSSLTTRGTPIRGDRRGSQRPVNLAGIGTRGGAHWHADLGIGGRLRCRGTLATSALAVCTTDTVNFHWSGNRELPGS